MEYFWNPWHGCRRYSEGCENCYMFYLDKQRGRDGGDIYKVKTNFNLPVKRDRSGAFKIPEGSTVNVCLTSDFFLEDADPWRDEAWTMIKARSDVFFWLLTKRAPRMEECLPADWGDGYPNVSINVTVENQRCADERLPLLLKIPAKHKGAMVAPFIGPIDMGKYLESGQIESVIADGENYEGARPLRYEWVESLYGQCVRNGVPFSFRGIGSIFVKNGRAYHVPKAYQHVQALRSGLQYPPSGEKQDIQPRCTSCSRKDHCSGCSWCGKCAEEKL